MIIDPALTALERDPVGELLCQAGVAFNDLLRWLYLSVKYRFETKIIAFNEFKDIKKDKDVLLKEAETQGRDIGKENMDKLLSRLDKIEDPEQISEFNRVAS